MPTLIFDIETVGETWGSFDEVTKSSLLRYVDRVAKNNEDRALLERDIKEGLGFSPLTGSIVALGLYDLERERGVVYYTGPKSETKDIERDHFTYKVRTEIDLLEEFWQGAEHYDTFVTFNGRTFDSPFLFHRSATTELDRPRTCLKVGTPISKKQ